ncbi:hypothetical protein DMN91_004313 [Ooceraea biroi]|uniref:Uncharacterized protein n=1 Tax=Ooceraea biroi TaxID=2015173 RepID=A0A026X0E0_OOCBI|nr:uncharacterized protein LOC105285095 [Ooceraea biroi]XP_011347363.1 uncharacterized protein LOC105285095 [Ooceraea biroi]EZA61548.1 hypothetical protein X777_07881 [Ooceraea biroi]RLU24104.1 hypothetical protein DMN91_004313 [Ooceraea biroi]
MSSSKPRRPIISIYNYPEHLNPFNDDATNPQPQTHQESKSSSKESKHKFWTFGRSRKKRSNSFSLKSTWNGLFGKRKETPEPTAKRSTITTVSTTYKREPYDKPTTPPRLSKDQQEFDEALGTLTRRRKYTLDNNTGYGSNLTVNGDPARLYDGNPQDTTTSIMNVDLTPKPPIRRFGQVSPRPTDKIPPLDFDKQPKQNGDVTLRDKSEGTPVPPIRRFGNRASQRSNGPVSNLEEDSANRPGDTSLRDENENVAEDYVFKRFSQDAVRRSNVSINSCVSVTSTASTYGRKKRRAPQPPQRREQLETSPESNGPSVIEVNKAESTSKTNKEEATEKASKTELQIADTIDIVRATENIDEMTKKSCEEELNEKSSRDEEEQIKSDPESLEGMSKSDGKIEKNETCKISEDCKPETEECENSPELGSSSYNPDENSEKPGREKQTQEESKEEQSSIAADSIEQDSVNVEYERTSQEKLEIIKDIDQDSDEVCLRKKGSLSRSDSFSVKEEIEKIERQIKALESRQEQESIDDAHDDESAASGRLSIQANRRHFFENMVDGPSGPVKLEFKTLPCEQKDIHVVRLTDPPVPVAARRDPVKVIELHISEPIKRKPELLDEVNPIPKPRRQSALSLRDHTEAKPSSNETQSPGSNIKRGQSV